MIYSSGGRERGLWNHGTKAAKGKEGGKARRRGGKSSTGRCTLQKRISMLVRTRGQYNKRRRRVGPLEKKTLSVGRGELELAKNWRPINFLGEGPCLPLD